MNRNVEGFLEDSKLILGLGGIPSSFFKLGNEMMKAVLKKTSFGNQIDMSIWSHWNVVGPCLYKVSVGYIAQGKEQFLSQGT